MAKPALTIYMDEELKREFEAFCDDVEMTMEVAINIFARKVVSEYRIPFDIAINKPNAQTLEAFAESERMKADPSLGKTYTDLNKMFEDILENASDKNN